MPMQASNKEKGFEHDLNLNTGNVKAPQMIGLYYSETFSSLLIIAP